MALAIRGFCHAVVNSFFRDVRVIGEQRIPACGPVIFFGNHGNQFVDAAVMVSALPRYPRFLIAAKSMNAFVIGSLARWAGSIGVNRPQDCMFSGTGLIHIAVEEGKVNTYRISGKDTSFRVETRLKDSIVVVIEGEKYNFIVVEVLCDNTLLAESRTFKVDLLPEEGSDPLPFKICPKVDQSQVYSRVSETLADGASIAIFPEGGSHDHTELLPLKPGVAIMALEAAAMGVQDILLVPVGIFYSNPKKIMSLATVEINRPIRITKQLVDEYLENKQLAISKILNLCKERLEEVIISAVDEDVLESVRLARFLYPPTGISMDNERCHQLFHFFSRLFREHKDNPIASNVLDNLQAYNSLIRRYGLTDSNVFYLRLPFDESLILFVESLPMTLLSLFICLTTFPIWVPIRIVGSFYATRKSKKALKDSSVKVRGSDVVASHKIIIMLMIFPLMNVFYGTIFALTVYGFDLWRALRCNIFTVLVFPILYYVAVKNWARLKERLWKLVALTWSISRTINVWRQDDRMILQTRRQTVLLLRSAVEELLNATRDEKLSESMRNELNNILPQDVIESDTRRIERLDTGSKEYASTGVTFCDFREEML